MRTSHRHHPGRLALSSAEPRVNVASAGGQAWPLLAAVMMLTLVLIGGAPQRVQAQTGATVDLTMLSLEELDALSISAASRRSQPLFETPAAVSVLLPEDIRRGGFNSVADALRLVPGVQVAQASFDNWMIGVRGFSGVTSTKLLVLVDGRNVYSSYYGGVGWQDAELPLADIERVEVVRGPGGSLWGANAVNGIVNIRSRSARDTVGGLVSVRTGTAEALDVHLRQGGTVGERTWYRVSVRARDLDGSLERDGGSSTPEADAQRLDVRTDTYFESGAHLVFIADYLASDRVVARDPALPATEPGFVESQLASVLGRLELPQFLGGEATVQLYADYRDDTARDAYFSASGQTFALAEDGRNLDFDFSHRLRLGTRHDFVWGGGWRRTQADLDYGPPFQVQRPREQVDVSNLFLQDEITLVPDRLRLELGTKLEHHESIGTELLPSGRLTWLVNDQHTLWGAWSRSVRSPTRSELDTRFTIAMVNRPDVPLPVLVQLVGDPELEGEELVAWEAGWRWQPSPAWSWDLALYRHDYDQVRELEPEPVMYPAPPFYLQEYRLGSGQSACGYGAEASLRWRPEDRLEVSATYAYAELSADEPSPLGLFASDYYLPRHMGSVRVWCEGPRGLEFTAALYGVEAVPEIGAECYWRNDFQVLWRPRYDLELAVGVQNAFDAEHVEQMPVFQNRGEPVRRGVFIRGLWRF